MAYDCVKVIVVRDGSAILFSEFGHRPVKIGDVILLGANVRCGSEPEGQITVSTIYLDTDYMLDQVRWQYAAFLEDRLDGQGFAETIYTEPAQILRLGEDRGGDADAVAGRTGLTQHYRQLRGQLSADAGAVVPGRLCHRPVHQGLACAHLTFSTRAYPTRTPEGSPLRTTPS